MSTGSGNIRSMYPVLTLRRKVRLAEEPDNPLLIRLWLQQDCCCPQYVATQGQHIVSKKLPCRYCSLSRQQEHYEQLFRLLLETIVDELLPIHWRQQCLDYIHKPLYRLRLLANHANDSGDSLRKVQRLFYELSIHGEYIQSGLYQGNGYQESCQENYQESYQGKQQNNTCSIYLCR